YSVLCTTQAYSFFFFFYNNNDHLDLHSFPTRRSSDLGFDERFTSAWREDSDLHFRLLEQEACIRKVPEAVVVHPVRPAPWAESRSEEHTSELQSQSNLVCRLLLEKKKRRMPASAGHPQ